MDNKLLNNYTPIDPDAYKSEPFDKNALLEVRHLYKTFPIKKSLTEPPTAKAEKPASSRRAKTNSAPFEISNFSTITPKFIEC